MRTRGHYQLCWCHYCPCNWIPSSFSDSRMHYLWQMLLYCFGTPDLHILNKELKEAKRYGSHKHTWRDQAFSYGSCHIARSNEPDAVDIAGSLALGEGCSLEAPNVQRRPFPLWWRRSSNLWRGMGGRGKALRAWDDQAGAPRLWTGGTRGSNLLLFARHLSIDTCTWCQNTFKVKGRNSANPRVSQTRARANFWLSQKFNYLQ